MSNLLVSITCITYNHAPYIRQCLDGFLMQQCNFDFEILIHDDASTDETQDIIREYQHKYPNIIKPILQTENQYSKGVRGINFKFNFPRAKGRFIALCEGDDYWIDPLKLQKQVDFLNNNSDYIACGCYVNVERFGTLDSNEIVLSDKSFDKKDIIYANPLPTLTLMMRKLDFSIFQKYHPIVGDIELFLYLSKFGKFMKLGFLGGVYRYHGKGANSGNDYYFNSKQKIKSRVLFNSYLQLDNKTELGKMINKYIFIEIKKMKRFVTRNYSFKKSFDFIKYCIEMKKTIKK